MEQVQFKYTPAFDPALIRQRLLQLLVPGSIVDSDLDRRIVRLAELFQLYAANYPFGLWAPGLVVSQEMRALTELYLPLTEVRRAFRRLLRLSLRFPPLFTATPFCRSVSWLDVLQRLQPLVNEPDPAKLLRRLMSDGDLRRQFIFAIFLPKQYGGGFCRYPGQLGFLKGWLAEHRPRLAGGLTCLDAACGSGEGTYELALLLLERGFTHEHLQVHGSTLEPVELFAAAHAYFPHDPPRETAYRQQLQQLITKGVTERLVFSLEDLSKPQLARAGYDIILCNGLLGGPLLHDRRELSAAVEGLAQRLNRGGVLLVADHFHGGWKELVPNELLEGLLMQAGLRIVSVVEGVAGEKRG